MDFKLSEEENLIRVSAARFVERELLPREGAYLRQRELFLPPGDPPRRDLDSEVRGALKERAKAAGLWSADLPGPADNEVVSAIARVLIRREFGRTVVPFEPPAIPRVVADRFYGGKSTDGGLAASLAFSEIHQTGNVSDVRAEYRPLADGYLVNAAGLDVFNPRADVFFLPVRERGIGRVSLLAVDRNAEGLSLENSADLTTDGTVAKLTLADCKAGTDQMIGHEYEVCEVIAAEQLRIAARSLGIATRCLAESIKHAQTRVTFGRPLATRQAIQWMLADLSVALSSCTFLTLEAAWRADHELPYFAAAAAAKKRAAATAFEAADAAVQIHGGYGVCKELPFEGFYREARMMRLLYGREGEIDRAIGERFLETVGEPEGAVRS